MNQKIVFDHEPTKPSPWDVWLAKQVKEKTVNAQWKVTQLTLGIFGDSFWKSYSIAKKMFNL